MYTKHRNGCIAYLMYYAVEYMYFVIDVEI